jgi:hypothetical protein
MLTLTSKRDLFSYENPLLDDSAAVHPPFKKSTKPFEAKAPLAGSME